MLAGRKKREQDREGKRTTEPKTEDKMTKLQKIKKETKERGQGVIQALPFSRHNCLEPLVTDDFTATHRSVDSTHINSVHTQTHTCIHSFSYTFA